MQGFRVWLSLALVGMGFGLPTLLTRWVKYRTAQRGHCHLGTPGISATPRIHAIVASNLHHW